MFENNTEYIDSLYKRAYNHGYYQASKDFEKLLKSKDIKKKEEEDNNEQVRSV